MPFQPGQSGNPNGRPPKGRSLADCLRAELSREVKGKSKQQRIAEVVTRRALKGEMDAVRFIADRVDGKVPDRVESDVNLRGGVQIYLPERKAPSE